MDHYIIVDCGTGSGRVLIFNELGEEIALTQREWIHRNFANVPGAIDFDTKNNWIGCRGIVRERRIGTETDQQVIHPGDLPPEKLEGDPVFGTEVLPHPVR